MIKLVLPDQKSLVQDLVKIEFEAFGTGGLNEWTMVPIVKHGRVFYIEENNKVLGSAQFMLDWNDHYRAYLIGISIAKAFHGKGYGTALLQASMNSLSDEGIERIELTVDPGNKPAIEVYQRKLGFVILETRNDEYGQGIHRLVMEKNLSAFHN